MNVTTAQLLVIALFTALVLLLYRRLYVLALTAQARSWVPLASRVMSRWVGRREYTFETMAGSDGAPAASIARRQRGLAQLADSLARRHARSIAWLQSVKGSLSDLRFTDVSRVPFPFAAAMRERFDVCAVVTASSGPHLKTCSYFNCWAAGGFFTAIDSAPCCRGPRAFPSRSSRTLNT